MNKQKPVITHFDAGRLRLLIAAHPDATCRTSTWLRRLGGLLDQAHIVASEQVPPQTVTMNSRLRLLDKNSLSAMDLTLVFPANANAVNCRDREVCVSVLTPIGLSVLGRSVGHEIHGRISIDQVIYQPEAAGEYDL